VIELAVSIFFNLQAKSSRVLPLDLAHFRTSADPILDIGGIGRSLD